MKQSTKARVIGAAFLVGALYVIGAYNISGPEVLLSTLGFAVAFELVVVRPMLKSERSAQAEGDRG